MKRTELKRRTPLKPSGTLKRSWPLASRKTAEHRAEVKQKAKTRGAHVLELQAAFNEWVRLRDAGQPCISCGTYQGEWHAGHYRSVGSCPELRFEPSNCFRQCAICNVYRSGNLAAYRVNLIEKIGLERVEWLEGSHPPIKLTVAEITELKAHYRAKVRELKKLGITQPEMEIA